MLHKMYAHIERRYPHFVEFGFATLMRLIRLAVRRPHLVVRRYGHLFKLSLNDVALTPKLLLGRIHEPLETHFMELLVLPGDVVLDVGANIGWFSILLADLVGPKGRVIAFEPDPANVGLLRANVRLNGMDSRVTVVAAAAGATNGKAVLYRTEVGNHGDQRLFATVADGFGPGALRGTVTVDVLPIDQILAPAEQVTLVKMDIQGYEPFALEGMVRTLADNPGAVLLSEFWPAGLLGGNTDPRDYLDRLLGLGLSIFELSDDKQAISRADPDELVKQYPTAGGTFTNLLAVHSAVIACLPEAPWYSLEEFVLAVRRWNKPTHAPFS